MLPNVFANKIDKVIKNNNDYYRGDKSVKKKSLNELKSYFDKRGYVNRLLVEIETKKGKSMEKLVLCKSNYFVNINNEKIYFEDIVDYVIKK